MPIINRLADRHDAITAWRREYHQHPELLFEVHKTAASVAEKLREFGCDEVVEGLGRTGVVGVIKGGEPGDRVIGLRADLDALPLPEITGLPHASTVPGVMHACGHDGHTAMLLGAAEHLCETRNFAGTAVVIFQPAEEGGGGGKEMCDDGLMSRFGIQQVYGLHNMPGLPVGDFSTRPGPIMAATDTFEIEITGKGGHAAMPHNAVDTLVVVAQLITAMQTVVSRSVDPVQGAVVSVTKVDTDGDAFNVLPESARLKGTVRTLVPEMRETCEARITELVATLPTAFGARGQLTYTRGYPMTVNSASETAFAVSIAEQVSGVGRVDSAQAPVMGGEDFAYMLQERPGAFMFIGNGDTAALHNPAYDFNDEVIPVGCSYWVTLVETALPKAA
ncbi:MAG: M20 aminoacylase family protein [Pseudomonadota bacterium]